MVGRVRYSVGWLYSTCIRRFAARLNPRQTPARSYPRTQFSVSVRCENPTESPVAPCIRLARIIVSLLPPHPPKATPSLLCPEVTAARVKISSLRLFHCGLRGLAGGRAPTTQPGHRCAALSSPHFIPHPVSLQRRQLLRGYGPRLRLPSRNSTPGGRPVANSRRACASFTSPVLQCGAIPFTAPPAPFDPRLATSSPPNRFHACTPYIDGGRESANRFITFEARQGRPRGGVPAGRRSCRSR